MKLCGTENNNEGIRKRIQEQALMSAEIVDYGKKHKRASLKKKVQEKNGHGEMRKNDYCGSIFVGTRIGVVAHEGNSTIPKFNYDKKFLTSGMGNLTHILFLYIICTYLFL